MAWVTRCVAFPDKTTGDKQSLRREINMFIRIFFALVLTAGFQAAAAAQSSGPDTSAPGIDVAAGLIRDKKWDAAATALEVIVRNEPSNKRAWGLLGLARHSLAKYPEAVAAYERSFAIAGDPITAYNMACSYSRMRNRDKAFEWLHKAADLGFSQSAALRQRRRSCRYPQRRTLRGGGCKTR